MKNNLSQKNKNKYILPGGGPGGKRSPILGGNPGGGPGGNDGRPGGGPGGNLIPIGGGRYIRGTIGATIGGG